jgi:hypothetical protein
VDPEFKAVPAAAVRQAVADDGAGAAMLRRCVVQLLLSVTQITDMGNIADMGNEVR